MANECIEYKLHRNDQGRLTTPSWMSDGGYFQNPADKSIVGFVPVEGERDWFVPDTVSMLTEQEFVNRGMAIHQASPFVTAFNPVVSDDVPEALTNQQAEDLLRSFYQSKVA